MLLTLVFLLLVVILAILILILAELKKPKESEWLLQREILAQLKAIQVLLQGKL